MKTNINKLTEEQIHITQKGGTEEPFSGEYCNFFQLGIYLCICCEIPLFSSESKYNSGGGWPDFKNVIKKEVIKYIEKDSFGTKKIEVKCNNCNAHLGHIFNDGPPPDFKRY